MNEPTDKSFEALSQDARVVRSARMLDESKPLAPNVRGDIIERAERYLTERGCTLKRVAAEAEIPYNGLYDALHLRNVGRKHDGYLAKIHNYMERSSHREGAAGKHAFVETAVARDIIACLSVVAESGMVGVVWGPPDLGKSRTLKALAGHSRFGSPVIVTLDPGTVRPLRLCRAIADAFGIGKSGTLSQVFDRLAARLENTHRMICIDRFDAAEPATVSTLLSLHERTGCPLFLVGVHCRLALRVRGDGSDIDRLSTRVIIRRDLTARTRGDHPEPLYSLDDIRKLVTAGDLRLHVEPDALRWLQDRASSMATAGIGGIGAAMACLRLAERIAHVQGAASIGVVHLEAVERMQTGETVDSGAGEDEVRRAV